MSLISDSTTVCISSFIDDHQCTRSIHGRGHSQTTQATLVAILPSYCPRDIKRDIQREMGVQINYKKAWRAKEHGISEINGSFEDAYKKLPKYCEDLKKSNPFTTAIVDSTSDGRFHRMFLSFGASAQGFYFCRPMLGLDGTHLKSKYQGILLSATAVDALGSLFPVRR